MAIQDLVVKSSELGEAAVEQILKPYVRFVDNGEISFDTPFFALKSGDKVSIALIAKDSWRYIPGKESFAGGMRNEEIEKTTLLPGNTVRPVVKLFRDKLMITTEKGVHRPTAKLILVMQKKLQKK